MPSYLEVRAVETTCLPTVGDAAGGQSCAHDGDCRSGLCAAGACFMACHDSTQCGSGTCDPHGVSMSLDTVRAGLGSASGPGCR